jgi:hypothetical protein
MSISYDFLYIHVRRYLKIDIFAMLPYIYITSIMIHMLSKLYILVKPPWYVLRTSTPLAY